MISNDFRHPAVVGLQDPSLVFHRETVQLVTTTDGIITADALAEVSVDGKTLTLDLRKFFKDPPEKWSIRIDGLGRDQ
jgi:hypothetical protein